MDRDWDAEWAAVQVEFYATKKTRDAVHRPDSLWPTNRVSETVRRADRRFDAAESRRDAFIAERKSCEPTWSEAD